MTLEASQAEIKNLKEVLYFSGRKQSRGAQSACNTKRKSDKSPEKEDHGNLELPEDAAQRWMSNAAYQASQTMLRRHGGEFIDG